MENHCSLIKLICATRYVHFYIILYQNVTGFICAFSQSSKEQHSNCLPFHTWQTFSSFLSSLILFCFLPCGIKDHYYQKIELLNWSGYIVAERFILSLKISYLILKLARLENMINGLFGLKVWTFCTSHDTSGGQRDDRHRMRAKFPSDCPRDAVATECVLVLCSDCSLWSLISILFLQKA